MKRTLIASLCVTLAAAQAAQAEKWDMPMAYSASNFHSAVGGEFASCVTTGTGGALEIVTHPGGSLFKGGEIKRAIRTGQVAIGERLLSGHQNEDALFGFDSVPFLATSFDDSVKLWEAAEPELTALLASQGLHLLYSVPWPPQGLYTNKAVETVADLAGLKFRAYNSATARIAELSGMAPVQIEAAELSQAFATGVAEAMISSGSTGYDRKIWEHLSHFYEVDAWLPRNYVMVNADAWNGLDQSVRDVVEGCAQLAEYTGYWRSVQYTDFTTGELRQNNMSVQPAGEMLKGELRAFGDIMTQEWLEEAGSRGQAIVDAFRAAQ